MKSEGFTLIELLVTLAVMVILVTIAVPGFQSLLANGRHAADYNSILSGLTLARSEAVKSRENVSFILEQEDGSPPWKYTVADGGGAEIRIGDSVHETINIFYDGSALVKKTITFNSLGKISTDDDCGSGCKVKVEGESDNCSVISISAYGRMGKEECGL